MTDLLTLAQRCIDAPGHATDLLILRYLHPEFASDDWQPYGMGLRHKYDGSDACCLPPPEHTPKRWTTSTDAAMTLVPEGWSYTVCWLYRNNRAAVTLFHAKLPECRAEADTPAQAICAAALIARSET